MPFIVPRPSFTQTGRRRFTPLGREASDHAPLRDELERFRVVLSAGSNLHGLPRLFISTSLVLACGRATPMVKAVRGAEQTVPTAAFGTLQGRQ